MLVHTPNQRYSGSTCHATPSTNCIDASDVCRRQPNMSLTNTVTALRNMSGTAQAGVVSWQLGHLRQQSCRVIVLLQRNAKAASSVTPLIYCAAKRNPTTWFLSALCPGPEPSPVPICEKPQPSAWSGERSLRSVQGCEICNTADCS